MKIALLGKIPKGDEARKDFVEWYKEYEEILQAVLPSAQFLHGDLIKDKEGSMRVVGHDLWVVKHADVVVVDARSKIGAGTAQEIVLAKYFKKPLASVIPKNTHHRRTNVVFDGVTIEDWIHPFLDVSSDYVASSIEDAALWLKSLEGNLEKIAVKGISVFDDAVSEFERALPKIHGKYKGIGW